jgi:hypothetical protein
MSPISAKNLLCLLAFFLLLLSCSREGDEPLWVPETHLGSKDYNGGLFYVWIRLKNPIPVQEQDLNSITWRAGKNAQIAYRKQGLNFSRDIIIADTAVFHWETPPDPTTICVTVDGNCEERNIYIDTIFAIVNGVESAPIIIEIKNILPKVTSLKVGGLKQPGDSTLIIAAHPGDKLEIELRLEKTFNKNSPDVEMPLNGVLTEKQRSDSLWSWEWRAPNDTMDAIIDLKIKDTGGHGERIYKIHLISYYEFGSVWVASENEIAKFSPKGSQVLSIRDENFINISDIAVHSNTEKLFVVDQYTNTFAIYDTYGNRVYQNKTRLKNPTSVAVDIEGLYVWIADSIVVALSSGSNLGSSSSAAGSTADKYRFRLRAFDYANGTIEGALRYESGFSGAIRGLSTDKYDRTRLWFTLPEIDTIGYVRYNIVTGESEVTRIGGWNRPSMISLNPDNELAWVADSSRIVAINKNNLNVIAVYKDFGFVSAVSASRDAVWATDIFNGKVYRFNSPFRSEPISAEQGGREIDPGSFSQPSFVNAYVADGTAWVMDRGKGEVVKVDAGKRIAAGTGLRPLIGKTIQKVE